MRKLSVLKTLLVNRPEEISAYNEKKIDLKNILIIDTICKSQKLDVKDTETVKHLSSIHHLTEMAIYINNMAVPNKTVLFIDSLTSMLLYSDENVFTKFLTDILRKMKARGINIVLLFIKTRNYDNIRQELKYLCDQQVVFD